MPDFARRHDDGLLYFSAKSLASGQGYRIPSLPETPFQTKYPPLYPAYLSLVWRLDSRFPENLALATGFSWMLLAACLGLSFLVYRSYGLTERRSWWLVALLGINPYMILFGCRLFSEILFTGLLLATFLVARRQGWKMALLAGVLAGLAYLSRTAGIALLISVPLWYLWKRDLRRAAIFAGGMLPFIGGWMLWVKTHMLATSDPGLIYYVDYVKFQFLNVGFSNLAVVLWKNLDQTLYGMGSLFLPQVVSLGPVKILTQVIAIAMISGIVRCVRRGIAVDYALFALISTGMLLVWHYPPNERFVLPLCPLLVMGLASEIESLTSMLRLGLRHREMGQRVAGAVLTAVTGIVIVAGCGLQLYLTFDFLRESEADYRARLADFRAAYTWIDAHLPASAEVLSNDDTLLYAYTGRRGNCAPLMPRWWYSEEHAKTVQVFRDIVPYSRSRGFGYVYATSDDLARWTSEDIGAVEQSIRENRQLTPLFAKGIGTLYQVVP